MISFERVDLRDMHWEDMNAFGEFNIFQTMPWLDFIAKTQKADPVLAVIESDGILLGYFTGLIVRKYGLRILGSPFRGWTTYFMGFNLIDGIARREVFRALPAFAFEDLGCHYLEIVDPHLSKIEWEGLPFKGEPLNWFAMDLTKSEDELFSKMKHACRTNIRNSIKNGVTIEESDGVNFAEEYFAQYEEVMANKSLVPAYDLELVENLIDKLFSTGNLLLLRAKNPEGICIATGIFLAFNKLAVFWGAASLQEYQSLRPNELLAWHGIRNLKAQGIQILHWGGQNEQFKKKIGCHEIELQRLRMAKYSVLGRAIDLATSPKSVRYRNWALRRL